MIKTLTEARVRKIVREETSHLVTKEDAKQFLTKEDGERFATKKDLIGLARGTELDELKIEFKDNLAKWKDELFTKIDAVLGKFDKAETERIILQERERMSNKKNGHLKAQVHDHESRIEILEKQVLIQ